MTRPLPMRFCLLLLLLASAACAVESATPPLAADTTHPWRQAGDVIDSILPMSEYLSRFRAGLTAPQTLTGGAPTPELLAQGILDAMARSDTAQLRTFLITRAEFAWLVFPDHRYAEPPYELDPTIYWMQVTAESGKGLERLMVRYGGTPNTLQRLSCNADTLQMVRGPTAILGPCEVTYSVGDSTLTRRLFGSMVVRAGEVKLMSYANDF